MFEITEDKYLISFNTSLKDLGLEYDTIGKLCFQGHKGFEYTLFEIKEWLEAHYRMYQYRKDNGVSYGEHELFYWHNSDDQRYFTVDIEHKNVGDAQRVADEITLYTKTAHPDAGGYICLQYQSVLKWDAINQFVMDMDISDASGLPLTAIARIARKSQYIGCTLTLDARDKLHKLGIKIIGAMCGKKVCLNTGMDQTVKGTLWQLSSGQFGVFKKRSTKTYYPVGLGEIAILKIA